MKKLLAKSSQKPQGQKKIKLMSEHLQVVLVQVSSFFKPPEVGLQMGIEF